MFDFNDELEGAGDSNAGESKGAKKGTEGKSDEKSKKTSDLDLLDPTNASQMLDDLLKLDLSPETENAQDALDLGLGLSRKEGEGGKDKENEKGGGVATGSLINIGSFKSKGEYFTYN